MTLPCDQESAPEAREEEQEIILRLSDILPRVPAHLLKPGPHDTKSQVRFSVDELAEKIARGRVSVPLDRLASVCPDVFRDSSAFPGEQEIPLPLQKLLDHVGLVAPKPPAPNGIPREQLVQARAEANRIIEAKAAPAPAVSPEPAPAKSPEPAPAQSPGSPPPASLGIGKVFSSARQFLGRLIPSAETTPEMPATEQPAAVNPPVAETQSAPKVPENPPEVQPPVQPETSAEVKVEASPGPADPPPPAGGISLRVLPIFRLLSSQVLRSGTLPPDKQRIALPLSLIDPQLAGGHVEIPIEDFFKALPKELRQAINPIPETKVWIPLDEIFQNLPADHLFHMPPLGTVPEPASAPSEEPAPRPPSAEVIPEPKEAPPMVPKPVPPAEPIQEITGKTEPEAAPAAPISPETPLTKEILPVIETAPKPVPTARDPEPADLPTPVESISTPPATEPVLPVQEASPIATVAETPAKSIPASPTKEAAPPALEAKDVAPASPTQPAESQPAEPTPSAVEQLATPPPPVRAPWMRGFQPPPPRLFSSSMTPAETPPQPVKTEPPPAPAATPEAKKTVDFLARQPGVFASAAFVQGAVFASEDFPRKPDLDALREFMGVFIDGARESGRRLGWNRVVSMACEQFHLTAVVRDTHFIVALHHDRVLNSVTYDALIVAADDLSKAVR